MTNYTETMPACQDESENQIVYHREYLAPTSLSPNIKKWLANKDIATIVAVSVPFKNGNPDYQYRAYAGHARTIARHYGHVTITVEDGITVASMSHVHGWHLVDALRHAGIDIELVE